MEAKISFALRNLRHLYEQMLNGAVRPDERDIANAARGLLGPAIEEVERAAQRIVYLENENEDLRCALCSANNRYV
jgi:hypothetical protein